VADGVTVDAMITVVDASQFLTEMGSDEDIVDRGWADDEEDRRSIAHLMAEQVEFATIVIVNKTDLSDEASLSRIESLIADLNPSARILRADHGRVPLPGRAGERLSKRRGSRRRFSPRARGGRSFRRRSGRRTTVHLSTSRAYGTRRWAICGRSSF